VVGGAFFGVGVTLSGLASFVGLADTPSAAPGNSSARGTFVRCAAQR
jgi:hypothetical protein